MCHIEYGIFKLAKINCAYLNTYEQRSVEFGYMVVSTVLLRGG